MVSGAISLPCSGCFSPFPHGTGSLSVFLPYLALRDGPRGFRQGSSCPALLRILTWIITLTCTRLSRSSAGLSRAFPIPLITSLWVLLPQQCLNIIGLGSFHFARHYFGNRCFFLFLRILRCFSSPRLLSFAVTGLHPVGFSHSDTSGSIRVCQSPELFAAFHVLLRCRKPRHPPYALCNFFPLLKLSLNVFYVLRPFLARVSLNLFSLVSLYSMFVFYFSTSSVNLSHYVNELPSRLANSSSASAF